MIATVIATTVAVTVAIFTPIAIVVIIARDGLFRFCGRTGGH